MFNIIKTITTFFINKKTKEIPIKMIAKTNSTVIAVLFNEMVMMIQIPLLLLTVR